MRRRDILGGVAAATLLAHGRGMAQTRPTVGLLVPVDDNEFLAIFQAAMAEFGYAGGRVAYEIRRAGPDEALALAQDLARLRVSVLVAHQTPIVKAAKAATDDIPIVGVAADLVAAGLVDSLPRPGGNITGVSALTAEMGGKCVELLREALPVLRRLGVLANGQDPFAPAFLASVRTVAASSAIELMEEVVGHRSDFALAMEALAKAGVQAVVVQPSLPRRQVFDWARAHRMPTACPFAGAAAAGALLAYSGDRDQYRAAAVQTDRILRGSSAGSTPVLLPTKFQLTVNLRTARELGLDLPTSLLARVDEVIE